jgi:hypothetical protein
MSDLLAVCQGIPLVPFERWMSLGEVASARVSSGISWCAVFVKAMAITARRCPELRRTWLDWPRPRLYQHETNVAMIAVERIWQGEPAVFFARVENPEALSLEELQERLRQYKTAPVEQFREYRRLFRASRLWHPPRRWFWRIAHSWSGPLREKYFGTFGVSVTAGDGASALSLISPTTTTLCYSPLAPDGSLAVRLIFDHRVLDGAPVARALSTLHDVLHRDIVPELRQIIPAAA